jgi:hypothetical protein
MWRSEDIITIAIGPTVRIGMVIRDMAMETMEIKKSLQQEDDRRNIDDLIIYVRNEVIGFSSIVSTTTQK